MVRGRESVGRGRGFAWVGRGRELDLLLAALEIAPAVVLVEGEAGVGKSRLVQEATAALTGRGVRVVTGLCHPLREPLPFGPVLDALSTTADRLPPTRLGLVLIYRREDLPADTPVLGAPSGARPVPAARRSTSTLCEAWGGSGWFRRLGDRVPGRRLGAGCLRRWRLWLRLRFC